MTMDVFQAVKKLREQLGRPKWLVAIGIGELDDRPTIILYTVKRPGINGMEISFNFDGFNFDGWEGYQVFIHKCGRVAPLSLLM